MLFKIAKNFGATPDSQTRLDHFVGRICYCIPSLFPLKCQYPDYIILYPQKMIIHQFPLIIWLGRNPEPYPDPRSALGLPGPTLRASVAAARPEPCHPCAHGAAKRPRGAGPDWKTAEGSEEFGCLLLCYCTSVTNSGIWV